MIRAATQDEIAAGGELMGYSPSRKASGVVFVEDGSILAMVLYDHWTYNGVQVHVWSLGAKYLFHPKFVREFFRFPFEQAGRNILFTSTPADNEASLKYSEALGFKETYRVKDGWKVGVDMIFKEMRKEQCRYLQKAA